MNPVCKKARQLIFNRFLHPDDRDSWPGRATTHIVGLQYLRGIAILLVVLSHCASLSSGVSGTNGPVDGLLDHGRLGVDIFFQISGFIIALVSLNGPRFIPAIGIGAFFGRRFIRIVPLMWIAIFCFAILQAAGHVRLDAVGYLRSILLLPGELLPAPLWTLRQELIFYVIFALSFLTGGRWRIVMLLWMVAIIVSYDICGLSWHGSPLALLFNLRNLGFGAGVLVALLWLRHGGGWRFRSPVEPLVALCLLAALIVFAVVPALAIDSGLGLTMLLLPLLLFAANVECPPGPARQVGELFGNASYAIYLFHFPAISALVALSRHFVPAIASSLLIVICFLLSTAAGLLAHLLIERPLLAALRRKTWRRLQHGAL